MDDRIVIYTLQYLRALAVALVVMSHIAFKSSVVGNAVFDGFRIGASGVDIFFVVSGFVMAMIYTRSSLRDTGGMTDFWVARFSRIFPLYWLVSTAALILFLANPHLVNANSGPTSVWRSYTLVPTLQASPVQFLIGPGWSLSFELYFYLLFSGVFLIGRKATGLNLVTALLVLLAAGSLTGIATTYLLTSPLLLEFVFGIVIFRIYNAVQGRIPTAAGVTSALLGFAGFVALNLPGSFVLTQRWWQAGLPAAFVVLGFLTFESRAERKPSQTLVLIGNASYALYLVHVFVLGAASRLSSMLSLRTWGTTAETIFWLGTLVATVIAGCVVHVYVERPLNRAVRRWFASASTNLTAASSSMSGYEANAASTRSP